MRNEILLETIERVDIKESKVTLFLEDRSQFETDKTKIIREEVENNLPDLT